MESKLPAAVESLNINVKVEWLPASSFVLIVQQLPYYFYMNSFIYLFVCFFYFNIAPAPWTIMPNALDLHDERKKYSGEKDAAKDSRQPPKNRAIFFLSSRGINFFEN